MIDCTRTTLAVLAGGEGRRMGVPKGQLRLGDESILERLLDRLRWPGPTLLVTAPGREHPPGCQSFDAEVSDPIEGQGPLRGILTALEHTPSRELVVVPVDMPNVTAGPLAWLVAHLRKHPDAAAVMARRYQRIGNDRIEPLPAAFRLNRAIDMVGERLRHQQLALHRLAESDSVLTLACPPDWPEDLWRNLNTPADLKAYTSDAPSPISSLHG